VGGDGGWRRWVATVGGDAPMLMIHAYEERQVKERRGSKKEVRVDWVKYARR
jgi:hypothetical protein